ncbi:hypothetical protein GGD65_005373 [Bradyrhizobium sp. CIR18]|nr:hypothetical protein [Bradyrhizobium sp. CIR18]
MRHRTRPVPVSGQRPQRAPQTSPEGDAKKISKTDFGFKRGGKKIVGLGVQTIPVKSRSVEMSWAPLYGFGMKTLPAGGSV